MLKLLQTMNKIYKEFQSREEKKKKSESLWPFFKMFVLLGFSVFLNWLDSSSACPSSISFCVITLSVREEGNGSHRELLLY